MWNFSSLVSFAIRRIKPIVIFFFLLEFVLLVEVSTIRSYLLGYSMEKDREFARLLFYFYNFFMLPKLFLFFVLYFLLCGRRAVCCTVDAAENLD